MYLPYGRNFLPISQLVARGQEIPESIRSDLTSDGDAQVLSSQVSVRQQETNPPVEITQRLSENEETKSLNDGRTLLNPEAAPFQPMSTHGTCGSGVDGTYLPTVRPSSTSCASSRRRKRSSHSSSRDEGKSHTSFPNRPKCTPKSPARLKDFVRTIFATPNTSLLKSKPPSKNDFVRRSRNENPTHIGPTSVDCVTDVVKSLCVCSLSRGHMENPEAEIRWIYEFCEGSIDLNARSGDIIYSNTVITSSSTTHQDTS